MGEVVLVWILGLAAAGLAIGSIVVLTTSASASWRLAAVAIVLLASLASLAAVFVGLVPAPLGLIGEVLVPVLVAVGLRYRRRQRAR